MTDTEIPDPLKLIGRVTRGVSPYRRRGLGPCTVGFAVGQLSVLVPLKKKQGAVAGRAVARIAQVEQPSMAQLRPAWSATAWSSAPDPVDKRSRLISTPLAARRLPKAKAVMDAHTQEALPASPEEVEQLISAAGAAQRERRAHGRG